MWLEGKDVLLYNVEEDPNELTNRAGEEAVADIQQELETILFDGWDPEALYEQIRVSQVRRLKIHQVTAGEPTYVNIVRDDDNRRYIRNAGAADTKAKARLPYVAPAQPDLKA